LSVFKLTVKFEKSTIKYPKITNISVVTHTISIYRKHRYLKCRYDTDTDIGDISMIFSIYIDQSL